MPILETGNSSVSGHHPAQGSTRKRWRILQNRIERARHMRDTTLQGGHHPAELHQDLANIERPLSRES